MDKVRDLYKEFCSKCVYKPINPTEDPCKECIDGYYKDWKNRKRKLEKFVLKGDEDDNSN